MPDTTLQRTPLWLRAGTGINFRYAGSDQAMIVEADATSTPEEGGFWPDVDSDTHIWRMRDRVFVGDAADATGNRTGTQTAWPAVAADGPSWMPRDATVLSIAPTGKIAVSGLSRASDLDVSEIGLFSPIGISGYADGDTDGVTVWGGYFEAVKRNTDSFAFGIEVDAKNMDANVSPTSYSTPAGAYGIWTAGGGDSAYGGTPTNPSAAAIAIVPNDSTWNVGLVIRNDALTDIGSGFTNAIDMPAKAIVRWRMTGSFSGFFIRSDVDNNGQTHAIVAGNNAVQFLGPSGNRTAQVTHVGSGVNYVELVGSVTTAGVQVNAKGTDTNIDLLLSGKGSGVVSFGTWTTNADAAVNGYVTIKDSSGNTRKLATIA
jgi:hypothetical protein